MGPDTKIIYGRPAPIGDVWEGVYIDDLLITLRVDMPFDIPLDGSFVPPEATETDIDMQKTKTAEKAYEAACLQRAEHKSFRAKTSFKAWGAEVDGILGRVGAPLLLRRQVWVLLCRIIKIGGCAKNILQRVVGYTSFILQYRRELFSLQHNIYCFMKKMPEQGYVNLPPFVIDELRSYALHLPFCITDMRRYVSETLFATDATPTSGGAVRAQAPRVLVDELWRLSEHRGSPERLDRDVDFFEQQVPKAPSKFVSMVSECLPWEVTAAYEFRQTSHINLQEARALKRELVRLAGKLNSYGMIQLCLNDSRVVVGAVAKGRSSSFKLNGILRSLVPFLILGGVSFAMLWVETHSNRADHPSRRELLPAPRVPPPWLGAFGLKAVVLQKPGLEIFTVSESLTLKAHERVGWKMLPAITVRDAWNAMDCTWDNTIANRAISFLWLSPPCSSFSALQNLNRDGPLRTAEQPEGDEADPKVAVGNLLWRQALLLAWQALEKGIPRFLEHPLTSRAWRLPETQLLMRHAAVNSYIVHMCAYSSDTPYPAKKPTRIITTAPWFANIVKLCPNTHTHGPPPRGTRARTANAYPKGFCVELARACVYWHHAGTPAAPGAH